MRVLAAIVLPFALAAQMNPAATAARQSLDQLLAGKYDEMRANFTDRMKEGATADLLHGLHDHLLTLGNVVEIGAPVTAAAGNLSLFSFPVKFQNGALELRFAVDETGKIAGLTMPPPPPAPAEQWKPADYVKPGSFTERDVTIGESEDGGKWKLPGTLSIPNGKGPFAVVILVHGSGPQDRDESIGPNKDFRDLAEGLASRGIAVLRYEKRTKAHGPEMAGLRDLTVQQETVEDVARAVAVAQKQADIDPKRVFVMCHSLGGYLLPRIVKAAPSVAGAISMAGSARPFEDLVLEQTEYLASLGPLTPEQKQRLDQLREQVAAVKKLDPNSSNPRTILNLPVSYMLDLKGYDPVAEAKTLKVRMMFLQGERDYQVRMTDFNLWKAGLGSRKDVVFHTYPALNHLFIAGEGRSMPSEYAKAGHVDGAVISDVVAFVNGK